MTVPAVTVPLFLYGDYGCPFTYVERARIEVLVSEGGVQVVWRPLPSSGGPTAVAASLVRDAAELGLSLHVPEERPDSRLAAQAAEFARDCGPDLFGRLDAALFRAVFVEGADIGDEDVLLGLADRAGVDREGLGAALADGRYVEAVREAEEEAERYGIENTPTLLIGRFKVVGAAPLQLLRETVAQASAS